ncbi:Glyoxalase family protein [Lysobacter dokdonensis DS-58]|uniref:Glyoxalase family protein n=1 Tax=Lysobacter dokdonensis DS-58 TaxID=1300345 RepID=A0A0A2WF77_9GAMM|nr:VOC family protein [Lysobacter dokdonensis]KGQ18408.1 Glyoxalase family protein [Lysobacter dokdonensis DS-58]
MAVSPIPEGYHTVNAYLIVDDAARAIDFYANAFGAKELFRLPVPGPDGQERVGHAEIRIGDTTLMLCDEWPGMGALGPKSRGGATSSFVIYGPDCDGAFKQAVGAGASVDKPVADQFWGDRMGTVVDPFGHKWTLGTHKEDVSPEELASRMKEWSKAQQSQADVT